VQEAAPGPARRRLHRAVYPDSRAGRL